MTRAEELIRKTALLRACKGDSEVDKLQVKHANYEKEGFRRHERWLLETGPVSSDEYLSQIFIGNKTDATRYGESENDFMLLRYA